MNALILAGGRGRRMGFLTRCKPKCLLPYEKETVLERLLGQLKNVGIKKVVIVTGFMENRITDIVGDEVTTVFNKDYKKDTNVNSMFLGIQYLVENFIDETVVFEADIVAEDGLVKYVCGTDFENKSVWFTNGKIKKGATGGMVKVDEKGNIIDIRVINEYSSNFDDYEKLVGIMRISRREIKKFYDILKEERKNNQYYLIPWAKNIKTLPSVKGNISFYVCKTFNTVRDYIEIVNNSFKENIKERRVYLEKVEKLFPIEEYRNSRVKLVKDSIIINNVWKEPIRIEKNHNLVLDGHHSLEVAKRMGLKYVPVIGFDYDEIDIWSLREEISVSRKEVIKNAKEHKLYPYKTVKHKFPKTKSNCFMELKKLEG